MAAVMLRRLSFTALLTLAAAVAQNCECDPARPETMQARQCSLCAEAERQPADIPYFFIKDSAPHKPNRWLLLPRPHLDGALPLARMSAADRTALWTAAIERARSLWGNSWGLAVNGDDVRTQCHPHIHIGKLLDGVEQDLFTFADGPATIPLPKDGTGMWIHPVGSRLHVHMGEDRSELVLMR
jgi:CDP-diacylglycerol pyrophosphatase